MLCILFRNNEVLFFDFATWLLCLFESVPPYWTMPFESGRRHKDSDVFAVCVDFIVPGFGTTYIAVFEDNEGAKNLAQNPVCTSNSKHIDVRPLFPGAYFLGEIWLFEFEVLSSATSRRYACYKFRRARRRGDAFRRAVCRARLNRVSAVVCLFV